MNCFVIMPFALDFEDVYETIKRSVTDAIPSDECRCFRLDESKPAGRITERLLQELRTAGLCIADITDNRPNVMLEVGYAMALGHPIILITQNLNEVPFDIRDMQTLLYDRAALNSTLSKPLKDTVMDTMSSRRQAQEPGKGDDLVGKLMSEVAELKGLVAQAVRSWSDKSAAAGEPIGKDLEHLVGAWVNPASNTHFYAALVTADLVVPYCYAGDRELSGAYYGWQRTGEYWFARYASRSNGPAGFAFFRQESVDVLQGAYWSSSIKNDPKAPPDDEGVPATWERAKNQIDGEFPEWATNFLEEVRKIGLAQALNCSPWAD